MKEGIIGKSVREGALPRISLRAGASLSSLSDHVFYWLLAALVSTQIADGLLTYFLVTQGLGWEGNPFLAGIAGSHIFLVLKVLGGVLCAAVLWDISRRRPGLARVSTCCLLGFGLVVVLWNASLFVWATPW